MLDESDVAEAIEAKRLSRERARQRDDRREVDRIQEEIEELEARCQRCE